MVCSRCGGRGQRLTEFGPIEKLAVTCDQCGGTGQCQTCLKCNGTGTHKDFRYSNTTVKASQCPRCDGSGIEPVSKECTEPMYTHAGQSCKHTNVARFVGTKECSGICSRCSKSFTLAEMIARDYGTDALETIVPKKAPLDTKELATEGRLFREET